MDEWIVGLMEHGVSPKKSNNPTIQSPIAPRPRSANPLLPPKTFLAMFTP